MLRHLRLVHRRHTGKVVAHRHTSHAALACILAIAGLFIFSTSDSTKADPIVVNGNMDVTLRVEGPAPTIGATITSPIDGAVFPYQPTVDISGTCSPNTFVIVYSNGNTVGSTYCTPTGSFAVTVQLTAGINVLTAKNYDGIDQPGPDTPSVTVTLTVPISVTPPSSPLPLTYPTLPTNPFVISPAPTVCEGFTPPLPVLSAAPGVAVVCMPWTALPDKDYLFGILVWGGTSPYALDIDFGDKRIEHALISIEKPGYKTVSFKYLQPGVYTVTVKMKDKDGNAAFVQTIVVVSGKSEAAGAGITDAIFRMPWFESPVPFYLLAVALTLGFWLGDLFDRRYGVSRQYRQARTAK